MDERDLPLPVALLLRRARNTRTALDRYAAALRGWECSARLAWAFGRDRGTAVDSLDLADCVASLPRRDRPVDDPRLLAAARALGLTPSRAGIHPRDLLDALPAGRASEVVNPGTAGPALADGLVAAWAAGAFWPPGARLVGVEEVRLAQDGGRRARLLDLTGFAGVVLPEEATASATVAPGRLYAWAGGLVELHPLLLLDRHEERERVLLLEGRAGEEPRFVDAVTAEAAPPACLDVPGLAAAVGALVRPARSLRESGQIVAVEAPLDPTAPYDDERFGRAAVQLGLLRPEQVQAATAWLRANGDPRSLAALSVARGALTPEQAERCLRGATTATGSTATLAPPDAPPRAASEAFAKATLPPPSSAASSALLATPTVPPGETEELPRARFEVVAGPLLGRIFTPLATDALVVGRLNDLAVPLAGDAALSRRHCLVQVCPPRARVRDLSKNGTWVNGRRLPDGGDAELPRGGVIRVGATSLRFDLVGPDGSTPWASQTATPATPVPDGLRGWSPPGLELVREVGRGGLGVVFEARQPDGARVAVKALIPEPGAPPSRVQRFLREASFGAQLDHPNAVRVLRADVHGRVAYFVMELVDGIDVDKELTRRGRPFSIKKSAAIVQQVGRALDAGHRRGFVHRDVKPSNILLQRVGKGFVPRLTDFGLMRSFEAAGLTYTATGEGMGTPAFMPPEQLESARRVGPPADVYALAATFYYMITLQPPLDLSAQHPLVAVVEGRRVPLRERLPDAPAALEAALARCLAMDPERRPQSIEAMDRLLGAS